MYELSYNLSCKLGLRVWIYLEKFISCFICLCHCYTAVRVNLRSIKHNQGAGKDPCDSQEVMAIPSEFKEDLSVTYSYSVVFSVSYLGRTEFCNYCMYTLNVLLMMACVDTELIQR